MEKFPTKELRMNKQQKGMQRLTKMGIVILGVVVLLLMVGFAQTVFFPGATEKEYRRIDTVASSVSLPSELVLKSKTKMYDSLSTIEGAGWSYRYLSTSNTSQVCTKLKQSLINAGFVISSRTCIDYPSGIYEVFAQSEPENIRVYSRIEGSRGSTLHIDWSRLHRDEGTSL
jgi:hypothetical protein